MTFGVLTEGDLSLYFFQLIPVKADCLFVVAIKALLSWAGCAVPGSERSRAGSAPCTFPWPPPRPSLGQSPCADGSWRDAAPLTLMTLGEAAGSAREWIIPSFVCAWSGCAALGSRRVRSPGLQCCSPWVGYAHLVMGYICEFCSAGWGTLPHSPAPGGFEAVMASPVSKTYLSKKPGREFPCPSSICWSDFTFLVFVWWYHFNTSTYLTSLFVLLHSFLPLSELLDTGHGIKISLDSITA